MTITHKIILAFLVASLLPLFSMQWLGIHEFEKELTREVMRDLGNVASKKAEQLDDYVTERISSLELLASSPQLANDLMRSSKDFKSGVQSSRYLNTDADIRPYYQRFVTLGGYYDLFFIDLSGNVIFSVAHETDFTGNLDDGPYRDSELARVAREAKNTLASAFSDVAHYAPSSKPAAFVATPVIDNGKLLGILALQIDQTRFEQVAKNDVGLQSSAETVIAKKVGDKAVFLFNLKHDPSAALRREVSFGASNGAPIVNALQGKNGEGLLSDYQGNEVLAAWRYIPKPRLGMVVNVYKNEALAPVAAMRNRLLALAAIVTVLVIGFGYFTANRLTRPLRQLSKLAHSIADGQLSQSIKINGNDELAQLGESFNTMATYVRGSSRMLEERVQNRTQELAIANRGLMEKESFIRAIFDAAHSAIIVIDGQGIVQSANQTTTVLFGYPEDEIVGQNINCIMPEPYHSEHDGYLKHYLKTGKIIGISREVTGLHKDGRQLPLELAVSKVLREKGKQLFVGMLTDISQRKKLEHDLLEHQNHLEELVAVQTAEVRAIVQTAVNGVITIDEQGTINIFNPAAELMFGYQSAEMVGFNVNLLMPEPYHSQHDSYLKKYLQTGKKNIIGIGREVVGLRKDGSTFPMYLAVGYAALQNGKNLFVAFVSDISEYKLDQKRLIEAKEAAEAGARAKAAFIANMSHEIRTPMNAILGFSEVALQDMQLSSATERHIRTIYSAAKSLLTIINDILDVSKLESGKFALEAVCFNLPNALADVLRTLEHRAAEKSLNLSIEYSINLPSRFMGDPTRLRQIVLNLVGNAIKFTSEGNISLLVKPGDRADMLHFSVRDQGIGMTPEQVSTVFEPFSQADASTTRRFGGTGLGTTISKQIVELMGGEIWVDSAFGVGSTFHFTARLPEAIAVDGCLYEDDSHIVDGYVSPRLFHILLAEDIEVNAVLATLRLEQQGHSVHWVQNGRLAVDAIKASSYDLILMDVQMPELDGLDATREIRALKQETGGRIPILALTASVMREDHDKCAAVGIDGIEAKPIDFNALFAAMERIVPAGFGVPRTTVPIATGVDAQIDFSPLDGVVDHAKGLKTWLNRQAYAKALLSFAAERSDDAEKIANLLENNPDDSESVRGIAHALKGLAGNLSITRISVLADDIDSALKSGQWQVLDMLLPSLRQALTETTRTIGKLQLAIMPQEAPSNPFDTEVVCLLLCKLCSALGELNPDVVDPVVDELSKYLNNTELSGIRRAVDSFDFDEASNQSRNLSEKLGLTIE